MTKPSLAIGVSIILFIVFFGLAAYFRIVSLVKIKQNKRLINIQKKQIFELTKKADKKKTRLEKLLTKIKGAGRNLGRINKVKELKKALRDEHKVNHELSMEIKSLEQNLNLKENKGPAEKSSQPSLESDKKIRTDIIKQKYPALPKNQLERIEIERLIARSLIGNNGGLFYTSQILRKIEGLYPRHIKPNDRITLFNEIKSWIERDPLCKAVKTADKIQHYTFI